MNEAAEDEVDYAEVKDTDEIIEMRAQSNENRTASLVEPGVANNTVLTNYQSEYIVECKSDETCKCLLVCNVTYCDTRQTVYNSTRKNRNFFIFIYLLIR